MRVSVSCREWTLIKVYNWNQIGLMRAQYHLVAGQNKSDVVWNSHQRKHDVHGWAPQLNEHWGAWPGTVDKPMLALLSSDCVVLSCLKIWKLRTSVQVDHSCRNSPCFNWVFHIFVVLLCCSLCLWWFMHMLYLLKTSFGLDLTWSQPWQNRYYFTFLYLVLNLSDSVSLNLSSSHCLLYTVLSVKAYYHHV